MFEIIIHSRKHSWIKRKWIFILKDRMIENRLRIVNIFQERIFWEPGENTKLLIRE